MTTVTDRQQVPESAVWAAVLLARLYLPPSLTMRLMWRWAAIEPPVLADLVTQLPALRN